MKELLNYPFNSKRIMLKRKSIKKELLDSDLCFVEKNVAVLGGSTTHDIKDILDLFLLHYGIKANFYESEYGQYWQDAMFGEAELVEFKPDIIYIHTSFRNIKYLPSVTDNVDFIDEKLIEEFHNFEVMWDQLKRKHNCPIIQNNFEYPYFRLLGNQDASNIHGITNFVTRLNLKFYEYANNNSDFYINDINYLSSDYGLSKWSDCLYWYMYKYCLALDAIPVLSFSVSNIIKSIFGKNKKAIAIDLDNTLWGGVIGDDGVENIEIGQETPKGQSFSEFQDYLKMLQKQGIILTIISKNDENNALAGLEHPQMKLRKDDFIDIKANWEPKSKNLIDIANEISLLPESLVFVDDNPAEREIVRQQVVGVGIPELIKPEQYIYSIDKAGYFETTSLSKDDLSRNEMYKKNRERTLAQNSFDNYDDYLMSLKMEAVIKPFEKIYYSRITQLTNKSNQFNLTTKRYTQEEIEQISKDESYITLYGKLGDCFGDNGIVSLIIAHKEERTLNIDLWLMSCRVLKRNMEFAMLDSLVKTAKENNISLIKGFYYSTAKNSMVKNLFMSFGFIKETEDNLGNTRWLLDISSKYTNKNQVINVIKNDD